MSKQEINICRINCLRNFLVFRSLDLKDKDGMCTESRVDVVYTSMCRMKSWWEAAKITQGAHPCPCNDLEG